MKVHWFWNQWFGHDQRVYGWIINGRHLIGFTRRVKNG